jgi:hypothetical protein
VLRSALVLTVQQQGAGETLRGTFNDTFDRRNPAAHAKNQAIIEKGRAEIEAARARQLAQHQAHQQYQAHQQHQQEQMGNQTQVSSQPPQQKPIIGAAPPPGPPPSAPGKTPYQGPPVSGSQVEGRSGGGGKLSNIMKKMKEGPSAGTVNHS